MVSSAAYKFSIFYFILFFLLRMMHCNIKKEQDNVNSTRNGIMWTVCRFEGYSWQSLQTRESINFMGVCVCLWNVIMLLVGSPSLQFMSALCTYLKEETGF